MKYEFNTAPALRYLYSDISRRRLVHIHIRMISRFKHGPITITPYVDFLTRHLSSSQPQPTYTTTFMTTLTPTDIKTLEQTRQRLSQLTNSLVSLQQSLLQSDPLPSWYNPFPLTPTPNKPN